MLADPRRDRRQPRLLPGCPRDRGARRSPGLFARWTSARDRRREGHQAGRRRDARPRQVCAELFKQHGEHIDGVVVVLPNFGDEKGVADTMRLSGLDVPILVQAYPDDVGGFTSSAVATPSAARSRSAATCASTAIAYTLTERHTVPVAVGRVPRGPGRLRRASARSPTACARRASGPSARGRTPSRPCATARSSWRPRASPSASRPLGDLRPGRQADRRPRQGDRQAGRDPRPHRAPHGARRTASSGWRGSASSSTTGWPSNDLERVGHPVLDTRSRRTTASTSARS